MAAIVVAVFVWRLPASVVAGSDSLVREFAPQHVVPALGDLISRGVLLPDIAASMWRLLVGLLIAAVVGIPLGLLIGLNPVVERASLPVVQFLRMISPLSWAPIALALFGIGHQPVFFPIAAAAVWPIVTRDQLAYDQVMAVIVVIGVLGFCLDWGARHLLRERRRPVRVEDSDSATSL